jgi:hypothetical protein
MHPQLSTDQKVGRPSPLQPARGLSNQVSDDHHRQRQTPASTGGHRSPGQATPHPWQSVSLVGSGMKRPAIRRAHHRTAQVQPGMIRSPRYCQHEHFAAAYAHPVQRATRCDRRMELDHRLDHRLGAAPSSRSRCQTTRGPPYDCDAARIVPAPRARSAPPRTGQTQPNRDSRRLDTSSRSASRSRTTHLRRPCVLAPG